MVEFKTIEEFEAVFKRLPLGKQQEVLEKAYELAYEGMDDKVYRVMATAIKYAKETGTEGHEDFQIDDKDLKRLSGIQDTYRHQDKRIDPKNKK